MSSDSREEREKLKEEYKQHYRKIREVKERLARSKKTQNISDALKNMDTTQLTDNFDEFLYKVKSKIANVEARLDVAMDSLAMSEDDAIAEVERDEELKKAKAKETLRQAKIEMGLLYTEIEQQADSISVEKTIGTKKSTEEKAESSTAEETDNSKKEN
ncbi:hypothetical protein G3570_11140 [Balneolaceae bacterium YR4-1]|uniref:Uncharacterized protein n=1 Tax=Halalkalibaculum roseum TaxID=2709311 RepID=A0A6M1SW80_9BACT|nr:hypothetical protein [Halalkalibaculum roseum]NGP77192.1 hypothetical protein [Halalkalibaculum roseum]